MRRCEYDTLLNALSASTGDEYVAARAEACRVFDAMAARIEELETWTVLAPGRAMPEHESEVDVTVLTHDGQSVVDVAIYYSDGQWSPNFSTLRHGQFRGADWQFWRDGSRITAWRPAPQPFRGGV